LERRPSPETTDLVSDGLTLSWPSDFAFDDFEFEPLVGFDDRFDLDCEDLDAEAFFLGECFDFEREFDFPAGTAVLLPSVASRR
jgi:hypothetical protein